MIYCINSAVRYRPSYHLASQSSGCQQQYAQPEQSDKMTQVRIQTATTSKQEAARLLKELAITYKVNQALQEIIADLTRFEQQYSLSTVQFYPQFIAGQLDDSSDYMVWASLYENYVELTRPTIIAQTIA